MAFSKRIPSLPPVILGATILLMMIFSGVVDAAPEQVHMAITQNSTTVAITWVTPNTTTTSTVKYGTTSGSYPLTKSGSQHGYDSPGTNWTMDGSIHDVMLTDLTPATTYYYIVGDTVDGWSSEFTFTTMPSGNKFDVIIGVTGDTGTNNNSQAVLNATAADKSLQMLLIAGDLSYDDNTGGGKWDLFFRYLQPIGTRLPVMYATGNHEVGYENGVPYTSRVVMPNNPEYWYSFDYGPVHVLSLSTEHDLSSGSEQYDFILNDLTAASNNRDNVPWIIVMGHKPMYTSNLANKALVNLTTHIEPLFQQFGVDIAIWGHNHCYERTFPLMNATKTDLSAGGPDDPYLQPVSPIHIVVGNGGVGLKTNWATQPEWSYSRIDAYGYAKISVDAENKWLHYQLFLLSDLETAADEFYLCSAAGTCKIPGSASSSSSSATSSSSSGSSSSEDGSAGNMLSPTLTAIFNLFFSFF